MSDPSYQLLRTILVPPISGSRPSGGVSSETDGVPSIGGENILTSGGMTYEELKRIPLSFFSFMPKGKLMPLDVLINKDGAQTGKVGLYKGDFDQAAVNEHVFILRAKESSVLDQIYLYYCVLLPETRNKIERRITGSAQPGLNSTFVNAVDIPLRSLPKQQKIAGILTSIDTAIEKTEALIEKYQHIKAGLMHDLFTRGVLPNGQLRPPREQAPELYQETAIGWIPKDWGVSGLAENGRAGSSWIRTGPFGSALKGEHWRNYGHPVITIGALGEGVFTPEELLFVNSKDAARLIDFQLKSGDVVFSRVADVGRSVVVREEQAGWIMSSNLMRIAVDEAKARPDFLQMALANDVRIKAQIRTRVNSGGRDVANSDVLSKLRFVWPDVAEQDRIIAASNLASRRLHSEQDKAENLRAQKLGLMQDLLTGKVPVKIQPENLPESEAIR
jgi:type I restriction enzyme S subunit